MSPGKQPDPSEISDDNLAVRRQTATLSRRSRPPTVRLCRWGGSRCCLTRWTLNYRVTHRHRSRASGKAFPERSRGHVLGNGAETKPPRPVLTPPDGACYLVTSIRGGVPQVREDSGAEAGPPRRRRGISGVDL